MSSSTKQIETGPGDVLVFVPGLGHSELVSPAHVAQLLSWELNQQAPDRATTFRVVPTSVGAEVVQRIERTDARGLSMSVLDVYGYDTVAQLDRSTTTTNPLLRVLSLGLTVAAAVVVLLGVLVNLHRRAKSRAQLIQVFAVLLMVLCIVAYFGIAVFALLEAVSTIVHGGVGRPVVQWPQWVVMTGAVVGGLVPTIREQVNRLGERSVQMARYTCTGTLRNQLTGGLQDMLDRIAQRAEIDRIHLVGYSFGSLVALETMYPQGARPAASLTTVSSLITIGSPFDIVRMVRPNYFDGRTLDRSIKPQWINVYQPIDVLGSNFRDDTEPGPAIVGLRGLADEQRLPDRNLRWNPDLTLNTVNLLMLRSLSVHTDYWDESVTARSALGLVVGELMASSSDLR